MFAKAHLAPYKVPKSVEIVDAIPRNDVMKFNRATLTAERDERGSRGGAGRVEIVHPSGGRTSGDPGWEPVDERHGAGPGAAEMKRALPVLNSVVSGKATPVAGKATSVAKEST